MDNQEVYYDVFTETTPGDDPAPMLLQSSILRTRMLLETWRSRFFSDAIDDKEYPNGIRLGSNSARHIKAVCFDASGRPEKAYELQASGDVTIYSYDNAGKPLDIITPKKNEERLASFDDLGRILFNCDRVEAKKV